MAANGNLPTYVCSPVESDAGSFPSAESWRTAEGIRLNLQDGTGSPALGTTVKLCYDDSYLYVRFECEDTEIQATMLNRDDPIFDEEVVEVFLDPDSDELTYYEFEVSPRNVVFDATVVNPTGNKGEIDTSWDCPGLHTQVNVTPYGDWTAEVAVPFASLSGAPNTPPKPGDRWRMNLYRIERVPREEYSCFSPTLVCPANYHVPASFGFIEFA